MKFVMISLAFLLSGCVSEALESIDDLRTKARIGVVAHAEVGWITETKMLEKVFRFYRQSRVDAVVLTGKVTKNGYRNQFEVLEKVWKKVFGDTPTRLICEDGAYDVNGFPFAVSARRPLGACKVLTFCGEGKRALTDELGFYPRNSNLVSAGSLSGVDVSETYFNAAEVMQKVSWAAQGLLVCVYEDQVKIRRLDFTQSEPVDKGDWRPGTVYAEDVAEPWIVGEEQESPPAPRFWDDTRVMVSCVVEKGKPSYRVRWPSVQKRFTGARARCYEVGVAFADEPQRILPCGNAVSSRFHLAEERDAEGASCLVAASLLAKPSAEHKAVVFAVTPIGIFGQRGQAAFSDPVPLQAWPVVRP